MVVRGLWLIHNMGLPSLILPGLTSGIMLISVGRNDISPGMTLLLLDRLGPEAWARVTHATLLARC